MVHVRKAVEADLPEIYRLVTLLGHAGDVPSADDPWQQNARRVLLEKWANDDALVLVADHPETKQGLVALGAAVATQSLPSYWLPSGRIGTMMWFYTEEPFRRQGIASGIVDGLAIWLRSKDCMYANLFSNDAAIEFYKGKGFEPSINDAFWLRL